MNFGTQTNSSFDKLCSDGVALAALRRLVLKLGSSKH
jgi:hypothetical protein